MLRIRNLRKVYPSGTVALEDISFEARGGTLGILGPNGAGKSSLMEILSANLDFEHGTVVLDGVKSPGKTPAAWRRALGYLPQAFDFPPHLTGWETMREAAALMNYRPKDLKERISELLAAVNLERAAHRGAAGYSRGMKQRLGLAMALLHEPRLLLLDEPTAGLDPVERAVFRDLLARTSSQCIVLLSTHIVTDIERCCEKVLVLHRGRILTEDSPAAIAALAQGQVWEMPLEGGAAAEPPEGLQLVSLKAESGRAIARVIAEQPPSPDARPADPTLEDGYLVRLGQETASPIHAATGR